MQATLLLLLAAGSWTCGCGEAAGRKCRLPEARGRLRELRDPAAAPAAQQQRRRRGVNVRLVAAAGPPVYLTQAEYGLGYGRVQRADAVPAVHVQAEGEDDDEQPVEQEVSPLRGGAMWALSRFLLLTFLCTLATGMAVCFAKQITAMYRALKTFCCLCVGRGGAGAGDTKQAASKPDPVEGSSNPGESKPTARPNRAAADVGTVSDMTLGLKPTKGNRASTEFGLISGAREPVAGGGVVSTGHKSLRANANQSQEAMDVGPGLRPPAGTGRLSARAVSGTDLAARGARRQAGSSPPARGASPRRPKTLRPPKSSRPSRRGLGARPDFPEDAVSLLCLSASASSQETLFDARQQGWSRGGRSGR